MSTARVGIQLDLMNGEQVLNEIRRIERGLNSLHGGKVRIDAKNQIRALREELERLEGQKRTIKLNTQDADAKIKRLKRNIDVLNRAISTGRGARGTILDERQIFRARTAVSKMNAEIRKTQAQKINLGAQYQNVANQAAAARQQINLTNRALQNVKPIGEVFTSSTSKISHLGSAMQSLGASLARIYQPVRMILNGTLFAAGYKLLNMAHEGLSNSLERYDTMENYAKSMAALGEDANRKFVIGNQKAMTAVENLNEAVLGLPTGLNEIVDMQKRFYSASNDMEKSTKMAIATNNAFLASGTQASEKLFGERQLRTLMSVGKLTSMQWASLQRTMPLAMDVIAKELGYGKKGVNAMTQDINNGTIAVDDFIDALIRLGTSGTIADAANVMKHSFQGVEANIKNAFSRMGYNLMKTFDQIFQKAYGKDTIDMLYGFRDIIDTVSEGLQKWVKENPDFFIDTLERLSKLDWKGFARGFGEGIKTVVDLMLDLGEAVNKIGMDKVGKFMAMSGFLSNAFTIVGGIFRGGRFLAGAGVVSGVMIFRRLFKAGLGAGLFKKLGGIFTGITGLGKKASAAEKATKGAGKAGMMASLTKWGKLLAGVGSVLAIIAGSAGTIVLSAKAIKSAVQAMADISAISAQVDWDLMGKMGVGFMAFVDAMTAIGYAAGSNLEVSAFTALGVGIVGGITSMVGAFGALDVYLARRSVDDMIKITQGMEEVFDQVKVLINQAPSTSNVNKVTEDMYNVYQAMFNTGGKSLSDIKKGKAEKAAKAVKAIESIFKSILAINDTSQKLKGFKGLESGTEKAISSFVSSIGVIYDSLDESLEDTKVDEKTERFANAFKSVKSIFDTINNITAMLPSLYTSMQTALGSFDAQGRGATPFTAFQQQVTTLFKGINTILTSMNTDLLGEGQFSIKIISKYQGMMAAVTKTFASIKKLVDGLPALITSMDALIGGGATLAPGGGMSGFEETPLQKLTKQMNALFTGLGEMYTVMNTKIGGKDANVKGMAENLNSVVEGITSVGKIVGKLQKLGGKGGGLASIDKSPVFNAVNNIKTLVTKLSESLNTETIAGIGQAVTAFGESLRTLLDQLNNLGENGNEFSVDITIKGTVTGQQDLINKIKKAVNDIKAQCKTQTVTKHIYVKIKRHVSVIGDSISAAVSGAISGLSKAAGVATSTVQQSHGGYIGNGKTLYRAKGGSVFKPKGTDVVPAMLSHGEYVQRKAAVDFWGTRFMQKINNLDINGAMHELSARASHYMGINRGTTINNNTTHNTDFTQNVYTSNPNFAFKRSSRYVGAL